MSEYINVKIDGSEYTLMGDDAELTKAAAEKVDEKIAELRKNYGDEMSINAMSVLAALNIAEEELKKEAKANEEFKYLIDELNRMSEYLISQMESK